MDAQKFVGLTVDEARRLAVESGLNVNVVNGVATMLTNSMQMNRLTLHVVDGKVAFAKIG